MPKKKPAPTAQADGETTEPTNSQPVMSFVSAVPVLDDAKDEKTDDESDGTETAEPTPKDTGARATVRPTTIPSSGRRHSA